MAGPALFGFGRHRPYLGAQASRDPFQYFEPRRIDAVVVGHQNPLRREARHGDQATAKAMRSNPPI